MPNKTITLSDKEDMLKRLQKVHNNSHANQEFYPLLLQHAGEQKVAQEVVMMLILAIYDYTDGLPAIMSNVVHMFVPHYIDALVDDKEVANEAKAFYEEAMASARSK